MHAFRKAVEAGDIEAALRLLADDVVFLSPVAYQPYRGKAAVSAILRAVFTVFEDLRYVREIGGGDDTALIFETRIGERAVNGCDFLRLDGDGLICEFMVMVRPLSGLTALAAAMKEKLA
jgi:hypothetical protein